MSTDEKLTIEKFYNSMLICFNETEMKYLSYGDFEFLLYKKGKIGRTTSKNKKELYTSWNKKFNLCGNTVKYPYRKFDFTSSRFKEITSSLIKDKKLIKELVGNRSRYRLSNKIRKQSIWNIRHLEIIRSTSDDFIGGHSNVFFYGLPRFVTSYPEKQYKQLKKLLNSLRKDSKKIIDIIVEMTSIEIKKLFNIIKSSPFDKYDKKLAFIYIKQNFTQSENWDFDKILYSNIIETKDFKWVGDGATLEYIPKNYIIDSKLSELLLVFQKKRQFFIDKLIVIEPLPETKHFNKFLKNCKEIINEVDG
jgi:hypothetical protein